MEVYLRNEAYMPSFAVRLLRALPSRSLGLRLQLIHQKRHDSDNDRDEYQDAQALGRVRDLRKEDYHYRGNDAERVCFFFFLPFFTPVLLYMLFAVAYSSSFTSGTSSVTSASSSPCSLSVRSMEITRLPSARRMMRTP